MKINLRKIKNPQQNHTDALRQIFFRALIILALLVALFYIGAKLSEQIGENYLLSHFRIKINSANQADKTILPSEKFTAILDLDTLTFDNYLDVTLSGEDAYKVEFIKGDKNEFLIISTIGIGDASFLYFIPETISRRGYDQIKVTPLNGNWNYWIQGLSTLANPNPADYPDHQLIDFEIKKLEIEIDEDAMTVIEKKAADALELGILLTEEDDYVPAIISGDGKRDDAEIRLKGDWTDHLVEGKWSFRIKMDNEPLWGMKKFSIHRPETRDGVSEYLIQSFYRDQGGIALRYGFVDVLINGKYMGVYALEEFFDKRLVENAFRREGPIIKVNEDYLWERRAYYYGRIEDWDFAIDPSGGYMDFDVFGINQTIEDDALFGYTAYAITSLNKLMANEVEVEEIFEIEQFAKYFAALDIFNSCHGNIWHNMRYYVNPVTAKMEPITFDELPKEGLCQSSSKRNDPLITPFFENKHFAKLYVQYLDQYLNEYDTFIEKEADNLARIETIFQRDNIYFKDYSVHLDELHHHISNTLYEDNYDFWLEMIPDDQIAIHIEKFSYLNIHIEAVEFDGKPVDVIVTNFHRKLQVDPSEQCFLIDDLSKFTVTYTTLHDGKSHVKSVRNPQLAYAFYTAGHIYGSHEKANTPQQDTIHPPFQAALPAIANNDDITFGVLTGDTVYKPSTASYGNFKKSMAGTEKPYYIAPGNHDLDGSGIFTVNFGPTYQSFLQDKTLFIILTPHNNWELDVEQLDFLKQNLNENKGQVSNIFIFTHYLFWLDGKQFSWIIPNGGPYKENKSNFWTEVAPLFAGFDENVYFIAGDVGAFPGQKAAVYEREGNLHFIASGMGGGTEDNYLIVSVFDDDSVGFELVPINLKDPRPLGNLMDR